MDIIKGLEDAAQAPILNLNANWTTKAYELGRNLHFGVQMVWDNIAVQGTMFLEYSCDPVPFDGVANWVVKNTVPLDGTFTTLLFLDSDLPVASFRLRFAYTLGAANLDSYIVKKVGG